MANKSIKTKNVKKPKSALTGTTPKGSTTYDNLQGKVSPLPPASPAFGTAAWKAKYNLKGKGSSKKNMQA